MAWTKGLTKCFNFMNVSHDIASENPLTMRYGHVVGLTGKVAN
jgi:hypothetical protein